jgi:hypothetical protein
VAVDLHAVRQAQLVQLVRITVDDAREIHHLGEPEYAPAPEQALEVSAQEWAPRRLELRGGDGRRRHEVEVERQAFARIEQPVHTIGTEDVRKLVRVEDDRCRAERQHEPGELVR